MKQHHWLQHFVLALLMTMTLCLPAHAATPICESYSGQNTNAQTYDRWSSPVYSYLTRTASGELMRVQYVSGLFENAGGVLVEYYNDAYDNQQAKTLTLPLELPIFGGFYEAANAYFIITGQSNTEEDDTKEVFRITKYDKNWNRLDAAGLSNCNTTVPFDAGSLRADDDGTYLLIRTSHEMYTSSDGLNHQSNVTIQLNMNTMQITDSYTGVMNSEYGYISHSFNQFIKLDNGHIVAVDHGDAYPRAIALTIYSTNYTSGQFAPGYYSKCTVIPVLTFAGTTGENATGAAVGGFEISSNSYLIAGHSVIQDDQFKSRKTRNIFVSSVNKSTKAVTTYWITDYEEGEETTSTPQLVKVTDDQFIVLWYRNEQLYYQALDAQGCPVGQVYCKAAGLSDVHPIVTENKVTWYEWNNNTLTFSDLDLDDPDQLETTVLENGHDYERLSLTDGVATVHCLRCGETKQLAVPSNFYVMWQVNTDGNRTYFSSVPNSTYEAGSKIDVYPSGVSYTTTDFEQSSDFKIEVQPQDLIKVLDSDNSYRNNYGYWTLKLQKSGTAKVRIYPALCPELAQTYTLHLTGPLMLDYFSVQPESAAVFGSEITLEAGAVGGAMSYQYHYYAENESGVKTELQPYTNTAVCKAQLAAGTWTLHADVKDSAGTIVSGQIDTYTVAKAPAPEPAALEYSYCFLKDTTETICLADALPEDRGSCEYTWAAYGDSTFYQNVAFDETTLTFSYDVPKETAEDIGRSGGFYIKVVSANYEEITLDIHGTITDVLPIKESEQHKAAIVGENALTYGMQVSHLMLNNDTAIFETMTGEAVPGTLTWAEPDAILGAGLQEIPWVFQPEDPLYAVCEGSLPVLISKAIPDVTTAPAAAAITYDPQQAIGETPLTGGTAAAVYKEETISIPGTWSFTDSSVIYPAGTHMVSVTFTPTDSSNYAATDTKIIITINPAVPEIRTLPTAGDITYGDTLAASTLTGGSFASPLSGADISGVCTFDAPETTLQVKDSDLTPCTVTFTPTDTDNYETICFTTTVHVAKATLSILPPPVMLVKYSVSDTSMIELPIGWMLSPGYEALPLKADDTLAVTVKVQYKDTDNYKNCYQDIAVTRSSCEHNNTFWTVDAAADCVQDGSKHEQCAVCGKTLQTELLPHTGHAFDVGTVTRKASLETAGEMRYLCQNPNCPLQDHVKAETIPAITIAAMPSADAITYGQTLADAHLTGGLVTAGDQPLAGSFVWADPTICPAVADSAKTSYHLNFVPERSDWYETMTTADYTGTGSAFAPITVTVYPAAAPETPAPVVSAEYTTASLSEIILPEGWRFAVTEETLLRELTPGETITVEAIYQDSDNYTDTRVTITITRSQCAHAHVSNVPAIPPTCLSDGTANIVCDTCQQVIDIASLPATGHLHTEVCGEISPEIGKEGYTGDCYCADCGELLAYGSIIPALVEEVPGSGNTDNNNDAPGVPGDNDNTDIAAPTVPLQPSHPTVEAQETSILAIANDSDPAGSTFSLLAANASKVTATSITLKWNRVPGADGYIIYGNQCGKGKHYQKLAVISSGAKTKWIQKKLKAGTSYKYLVIATGTINGTQQAIATAKSIHVYTKGKKYCNYASIKVNKTSVRLKKGKTFKIKTSCIKANAKQKVKNHRKLSYESDNPKVATVTKGKIKAVGKGTCNIYVYACSGIYKKIKVTVK